MKNLILVALLGSTPALFAQEVVVQEPPAKQDPGKKIDKKQDPQKTGKQDPKKEPKKDPKQDPKKDPKKGDPVVAFGNKKDIPIPDSADPADIAAIQGANKMIAAERRLAKMIREGKITGLDKILTFDEISTWPYEDGLKGMPQGLGKLDGMKVMMTGFMLPIDEVENIKEFLLVQSLWSCCYGQPPDINGIVRVVMQGKQRTDYFFDPLKIIGKFRVESTVIDGYCVDIYQLEVESMEAIR